MSGQLIPWALQNEGAVARGHPTKDDVINRALRAVLTLSGLDPDGLFTGFQPALPGQYFVTATGDGTTNDYASISATITTASQGVNGGVVVFAPGKTYLTNSILDIPANVSLWIPPTCTIKAGVAMTAVIRTPLSTAARDMQIAGGGTIDGNFLADRALHLRYFAHYTVSDVNLTNFLTYGMDAGDAGAPSSSYELIARNVRTNRTSTFTAPSGSISFYLSRASDSHLTDCIGIATETGFRCDTSGNYFTNCHAWSYQPNNGWMEVCFDDNGFANTWTGCYADTPGATPARLAASVVPMGFRMRNQNSIYLGCRVYNNALHGLDNTIVGWSFDNATPFATISAPIFKGEDATHRIKQDFVATAYTGLSIFGGQYLNVVNAAQPSRLPGVLTLQQDIIAARAQIGGGAFITNYSSYTATYDPPSIAAGAQVTTTVAAVGAALGNEVTVSFDKDLQGIQLTAYVSATNVVTVIFRNGTAGAIDLASGTLRVGVWKP